MHTIDFLHLLYQAGQLLSSTPSSDSRPVSHTLAELHPAQISHSIGLSLTGSPDLLREAFSLLIPDLTLGQTTNNSFPQGVQRSIIHTDLPWLQFSFIFSRRRGGERIVTACRFKAESIAAIFPAALHCASASVVVRRSTMLSCCLERNTSTHART